jgi:hypothetical protein
MNRDDILRIAKEADVWVAGQRPYQTQLERFADLILEHLHHETIHVCHDACVREAVQAEREACAKVCEPQETHDDPLTAWKIAAAIRERGEI